MRTIINWWQCVIRHQCGPSVNADDGRVIAVYSCERASCPGRIYNAGWADGYVMGDRDAITRVAEG
jgi:hypothetical protein